MKKQHVDDDAFEEAVRLAIPAEFTLIAGNEDNEEAQEAYKASKAFNLPNPLGPEGGACTSSLLQVLYNNIDLVIQDKPDGPFMTFQQLGQEMLSGLKAKRFDSIPQFSSSRPLGPPRLPPNSSRPFYVVPPGSGRRRALLIGCNYVGQRGSTLRAPHNDCHNVQQFLQTAGWHEEDMIVLKDDGQHTSPTRSNIEAAFGKLATESRPKDVVFVLYSGHGGRVRDTSGDEADGYDSSIFPVDYLTAGQIIDDDILQHLIKRMPSDVHCTMVVDACHSGTMGDLPYQMSADSTTQRIETFFNTDTYEQAMAKDAAADAAEEERKRAKAERKRQREEIRRRKVEEAEREKAGLPPLSSTTSSQPAFMMADPQALAQQLAAQMGAATASSSPMTTMLFSSSGPSGTIQHEQQPIAMVMQQGTSGNVVHPVVVQQQQQGPVTVVTQQQGPVTMAMQQGSGNDVVSRVNHQSQQTNMPTMVVDTSQQQLPPARHVVSVGTPAVATPQPTAAGGTDSGAVGLNKQDHPQPRTTSSKTRMGRSPVRERKASSHSPTPPTKKKGSSRSPVPPTGLVASQRTNKSSKSHSPTPTRPTSRVLQNKPAKSHPPTPTRARTSRSPVPPATRATTTSTSSIPTTDGTSSATLSRPPSQQPAKEDKVQEAFEVTQKQAKKAADWTQKHGKKALAFTQKNFKKASVATKKHTANLMEKDSTKKAQDSVKKAWAWTQKTGKKAGEATQKHTSAMLEKAKAARAPKN